jgi:hypothetical protein
MFLRALTRIFISGRGGGPVAALAVASVVALSGCESSRTSIGTDLLGSITDQETRRDTLRFGFDSPDPDVFEFATFQMQVSTAGSGVLLIGETNNLRAISMLRFPMAGVETELRSVYDGEKFVTDTLTITPVSIAQDSSAYLLLAINRYVSDPEEMYLEGWVVPNDWDPADSVTTEVPTSYFTGVPAFSGDTLSALGTNGSLPLSFIDIQPATIGSILDSSFSFAVRAISPGTMAQMQSLESDAYWPQLGFWMNATRHSTYIEQTLPDSAVKDTVIGRNYIVSRDTYRLERLAPAPQPAAGTMLVSGGDIRRGYLKVNRFDVWGAESETIPKTHTANRAVLELTLSDQGHTFQPEDVSLELLELGESFDLDSARTGKNIIISDRFALTAFFNTREVRDTTDANIRRFEISDVVNRWWQNPEYNHGLMITTGIEARGGNEMRRVDAVEVVDARLIVTSTKVELPDVASSKPAVDGEAK